MNRFMDLWNALEQVSADDAAAFVGYLTLLAEADAVRDERVLPHLERFVELVGFMDDDDVDTRQRRVDAWFEANPLLPELLDLLDRAAEREAEIQDVQRDRAQASAAAGAAALLDTVSAKIPVGHTRDPNAMRGGVGGLLQARLSATKKQAD